MRKHFKHAYFIFIVFNIQFLHAQSRPDNAVKLKTRLTDSICSCVSRVDPKPFKKFTDLEPLITKCVMANKEILEEYSIAMGVNWTTDSKEKIKDFNTDLLNTVHENCPALIAIINQVKSETIKERNEEAKAYVFKKKLRDSLCNCLSGIDKSSINTEDDIPKALSNCMTNHQDLIEAYIEALGLNITSITEEKQIEVSTKIAEDVYMNCQVMNDLIKRIDKSKNH